MKFWFIIILLIWGACTMQDPNLREMFSKQFPSDKTIDTDNIKYEKYHGYFFVKLKSDTIYSLICKEDQLKKEKCIITWGFDNIDKILVLDSIISKTYSEGYGINMISSEGADLYLFRVTKDDFFYKDLTYKKNGRSFHIEKERIW